MVAVCEFLAQAEDVRIAIRKSARLANKDGGLLPIGVVSPDELARSGLGQFTELSRAGEGERNAAAAVEELLQDCDRAGAEGVAVLVRNAAEAKHAEGMLWDSLVSDTDGMVDVYFNRPMGRSLAKILVHTAVTPNQVSLCSAAIGLVAAYQFAQGDYASGILGGVLFQISAIVDCIDGDIARMVFKESRVGKWLDIVGDQVVHLAVFGAIAWGASKGSLESVAWLLGGSAMAGAVLSFLVVMRGMLVTKDQPRTKWQRWIDTATSRDFSALVLLLACFDKLTWFLWMAAIGVHVFWVAALLVQLPGGRRGALERSPRQ